MSLETAVNYAQIYRFLADAFLYPQENWLEDVPLLNGILEKMGLPGGFFSNLDWDISSLQAEHRRIFGLTGSLCYETEYGLPHEFRQSQELADIAGFYQAFGVQIGGHSRERPDHLAVELEFMYILCLKEAYAISVNRSMDVQVCREAQRSFLNDHLASWVRLFGQALKKSSSTGLDQSHPEKDHLPYENPYLALGELTTCFVTVHAEKLGARPPVQLLAGIQPTPLGPELSCGDCPLVE